MEPFYTGNAFSPLLFRYRQVSLYVLCSFAFRDGFYVLLFLRQFHRYRVIVDRLRAGRSGVWIPVETRFFSGRIWGPTHPIFCSLGTGGTLPRVKWPELATDHSPYLHLMPRLVMSGAVPPLPPYDVMASTGTTVLFVFRCAVLLLNAFGQYVCT